MITPDWVRMMARYGAWQNGNQAGVVRELPEADLRAERGAFFGSVLATLSHVVWGDRIWLCRWTDLPKPPGGIADSAGWLATVEDWATMRAETDAAMTAWAARCAQAELDADLTWHSGALGREVTKPMALCVTHMFNHGTHHRGQVHAMLTAMGAGVPDTDLFVMPDPDAA
ncbi:DinB family protein [Jannaschia sp. Os4]|uniref:DinB family protein n=1 Tax=Jannaschia sp. Os4 TaxID=2807617 RepID=UPI00193983C7|nr:DinB family protein [Jannaschia sp. Os4]MBM2577969.1 DinB family protein [Jannaschia sp. Os4]